MSMRNEYENSPHTQKHVNLFSTPSWPHFVLWRNEYRHYISWQGCRTDGTFTQSEYMLFPSPSSLWPLSSWQFDFSELLCDVHGVVQFSRVAPCGLSRCVLPASFPIYNRHNLRHPGIGSQATGYTRLKHNEGSYQITVTVYIPPTQTLAARPQGNKQETLTKLDITN